MVVVAVAVAAAVAVVALVLAPMSPALSHSSHLLSPPPSTSWLWLATVIPGLTGVVTVTVMLATVSESAAVAAASSPVPQVWGSLSAHRVSAAASAVWYLGGRADTKGSSELSLAWCSTVGSVRIAAARDVGMVVLKGLLEGGRSGRIELRVPVGGLSVECS